MLKERNKQWLCLLFRRIFILLVCLQMALALVWALKNIGQIPDFSRTKELLATAESLVFDDYNGLLYPLLLAFFRGMFPSCYAALMYLLQTALLFGALYLILGCLPAFGASGTYRRFFTAAGIISAFPLWQLCFCLLPQVMATAFLLLLIYACARKKTLLSGVCFLLGALTLPACKWFGLGVLVLFFAKDFVKKKRTHLILRFAALLFVSLLLLNTANALFVTPHSSGKMANTFAGAMVHRFVWPNFENSKFFWPAQVLDLFSQEDFSEISYDAANVYTTFGYTLEETYGTAYAQSLYLDMAKASFLLRTKEILGDILSDALSYAAAPLSLLIALEGRIVSFSGYNVSTCNTATPLLGICCLRYSCNLTILLCAVALGRLVYGLRGRRRSFLDREKSCASAGAHNLDAQRCSRPSFVLMVLLALGLLQVLWYTFSAAGMQDYTNTPLLFLLWSLFALQPFQDRKNIHD